MSLAGSSPIPPVHVGAAHSLAPRDHGDQNERRKRKKPGQPAQDEADLTAPSPELTAKTPATAASAAPGPYSAAGTVRAEPERHLDLNG